VSILAKGRHPVEALEATLAGRRADGQPARFVAVEFALHDYGRRAPRGDRVGGRVALSREKYCSVWHSMRQDIDFTITYETRAAARWRMRRASLGRLWRWGQPGGAGAGPPGRAQGT